LKKSKIHKKKETKMLKNSLQIIKFEFKY